MSQVNNGAIGEYSHREGTDTVSYGENSHAEGENTQSIGKNSHTQGQGTTARQEASHAEGTDTIADAPQCHAEGHGTECYGNDGHTENHYTLIDVDMHASHAEGFGSSVAFDSEEVSTENVEGSGTRVIPPGGGSTIFEGVHVEGMHTWASHNAAHAEGYGTWSAGEASHSEGYLTQATGNFGSHSEGYITEAIGSASHAEGYGCVADDHNSHAEGRYTIAQNQDMHVAGSFNSATSPDTIHETGIGDSPSNRKNAFEIYTNGRIYAPELTVSLIDNDKSLVTKEYVVDTRPADPTGLEALNQGNGIGWRLIGRNSNVLSNIGKNAIDFSWNDDSNVSAGAAGEESFAHGYQAYASAFGSVVFGENSQATGQNAVILGVGNRVQATNSTAIGWMLTSNLEKTKVVVGSYNIDKLGTQFEVGIGQSFGKNGLEVYKTGEVIAPNFNLTSITDDKSLVTKEYVDKNGKQEADFDALTGEDTFVIPGVHINVYLYIAGMKSRSSTFVITNDGTDTTITLNTPLTQDAWVAIEY